MKQFITDYDDMDRCSPIPRLQPAWALGRIARRYWESLKFAGKGTLPRRAAIDPRAIAPALHSVFLASRVAMGHVRIRIGGRTLANLAGIEVMDMPLSLLFTPEARPQLAVALERVLHDGAIATLDLEAECSIGRPRLAARLVLLPLLAADEHSVMILGCLESEGEIGRAPRRFAIARSRIEAGVASVLPTSARMREPAPEAVSATAPVQPSSARQKTEPVGIPPLAESGRRQQRTHLRLVHSI